MAEDLLEKTAVIEHYIMECKSGQWCSSGLC